MLRLSLPSFFTCLIDLFGRDKTSIEFRSENLDQVLKTKSVAPYKAGRLCTISPSNLLFVDESKSPREIRWMDCTKEPKVLQRVISTNHKDIWEIQFSREDPAGTSGGSVGYDKPLHSASHCGQWDHFFLACGQTNSVKNPWISQSSLDLVPK